MKKSINDIVNQAEELNLEDLRRLISELESLEDGLIDKISND